MLVMEMEELLTAADIAKILKKSEDTVTRLFRAKKIPGVKIGGTWYISRGDWKKHLEDQKKK